MVKEVERLLYRPNINPKAQYYGICFLSQLMLERNKSSSSLATKLVNIYFSFFKLTIKKVGIYYSRIMKKMFVAC